MAKNKSKGKDKSPVPESEQKTGKSNESSPDPESEVPIAAKNESHAVIHANEEELISAKAEILELKALLLEKDKELSELRASRAAANTAPSVSAPSEDIQKLQVSRVTERDMQNIPSSNS